MDEFRTAINKVGHRILQNDDMIPELWFDAELDVAEVNRTLVEKINALEPFGAENPSPVFLAKNVAVEKFKTMGKENNHVRFRAVQSGRGIDAIGFGMAEAFATFDTASDRLDIAYEITVNTWNGQNKVELRLLDIRPSQEPG